MSKKISAGGRTFTKGETVRYKVSAGDTREFIIVDGSQSKPKGLILRNLNNKRTFAIDAAAVATRIEKKPESKPAEPSDESAFATAPVGTPATPMGGYRIKETDSADSSSDSQVTDSSSSSEPPVTDDDYREWRRKHIESLEGAARKQNSIWGRMGRGISNFRANAKRRNELLKERREGSEGRTPRFLVEILMFLAIVAHYFDVTRLGFQTSPEILASRMMMYLFLAILTHWWINKGYTIWDSVQEMLLPFLMVTLLMPFLAEILVMIFGAGNVTEYVSMIMLLAPIWIIYLSYYKKLFYRKDIHTETAAWWFNWITPTGFARIVLSIIIIVLFIKLVLLMGVVAGWGFTAAGGVAGGIIPGGEGSITGGGGVYDAQIAVTASKEFFVKAYDQVSKSVKTWGTTTSKGFNSWKNDTMSEYYTGQVEQNKEVTGISISDFHVTGKQYDSMPVVAYGYIKARSFVEGVTINTSCYAQSLTNKSLIVYGKTDPDVLKDIYIEDQRGVICTFDSLTNNNLSAGRYQLFLVLEFEFKTWAYKPYYFIDRGYYVYMKTSGDNPNTKLGIPTKSKTIYTNGPVMIGMDDALEMPFAISSETKNYLPIGMTIDDKAQVGGAKGQVVRVHNYTIRMPEYFTMGSCTTKEYSSKTDENVPQYTMYTFNNPNINLNGSFMTVNCNIIIENASVSKILPNTNTPAIVSIVGTADYDYKLSKQIVLVVEKTPGT
ncbi:MAG: hypothetical protein ACP5N2_01610 [Candidatus Nanoarchaeia archaeon]